MVAFRTYQVDDSRIFFNGEATVNLQVTLHEDLKTCSATYASSGRVILDMTPHPGQWTWARWAARNHPHQNLRRSADVKEVLASSSAPHGRVLLCFE